MAADGEVGTGRVPAAAQAPVDDADAWNMLGGGEEIDLGNPDDPDYAPAQDALPGTDQPATDQATPEQQAPEDDLPEFETDDTSLGFEPEEEVPALEAPVPPDDTPVGDTEPWADDPVNFDFTTLPAEQRAAAYQAYTQQHPDLALQRQMYGQGFTQLRQEDSTQMREMQAKLAQLEADAANAPEEVTMVDDSAETAAMWAKYVAEYRSMHGPEAEPNAVEWNRYVARATVAEALSEVQPVIERLQEQATAVMEEEADAQFEALKAKFPRARTPEAQQKVGHMLKVIVQARPVPTVEDGDVETAYRAAYGKELDAERVRAEQAARQRQAQQRTAAPSAPAGGGGGTRPSGPKPGPDGYVGLDQIAAHQKQRGLGAIVGDFLKRRGRG